MNGRRWQTRLAGLLACLGGAATLTLADTNTVPWAESFEDYADGAAVAGLHGWSADIAGDGLVTTSAPAVGRLADYLVAGGLYPLPASPHAGILQVTEEVRNDTSSATGGVVALDFLALPVAVAVPPAVEDDLQVAFCVLTNGNAAVWCRVGTATQWVELATAPPVATGVWTRFTIIQDYALNRYRISLDGGAALSDPVAGQGEGSTWFAMAQTNGFMARFSVGDTFTNYVDDVLVTNRSLRWAGTGYVERAVNDGTIDGAAPVVVTLSHDTFTGAADEDFVASGKLEVLDLPSGLTAVARRMTATQVVLTLTNAAVAQESTDSIGNLRFRFLDAAFALGQAWDVAGRQSPDLAVSFRDTPRVSYATGGFAERPANDGRIDPAGLMTVVLTNGTFNGTVGEDFGTNGARVLFMNLPAGLAAQLLVVNAGTLELRFTGQASPHGAAAGASVSLVLQDGAFAGVPAALVLGSATNFTITFADPSVLTYGATTFAETAANDGTVGGTTLILTNQAFTAAVGVDLAAAGLVTSPNLPAGLALRVIRGASDREATLGFTGNALAHAASNSLGTLGIVFADAAFTGGSAAGVEGAVRADLSLVFSNQPVLTAAGSVFLEGAANNGTVGNLVSVTLAGASFADAVPVEGVHYTVAHVPAGLTFGLTRVSASEVSLALAGTAAAHAAADSLGDLRLAFLDAAFDGVAAANVEGAPLDFTVQYADPPALAYSGDTFEEIAAGLVDNRTPLTITLTGDTFSGVDGDDFAAAGKVTVSNVPAGLAAQVLRTGDTQLAVRLAGTALAHAASNSVHDLGLAFHSAAFTHVQANQVGNYAVAGLHVVFVDDTGFFNVMPYEEPFESYPDGTRLISTNGWTADYQDDAATVTNDPAVTTNLLAYLRRHAGLPVSTNHVQALYVQDDIRTDVFTEEQPLVYLDFMALPMPAAEPWGADTNLQYAFCVTTNRQVAVWHRNTTGGSPTNEWRVLAGAPLIEEERWTRFTVAQDYARHRFQLRINEGAPVVDAAAWNDAGTSQPGSWFHMVRTNASMSQFWISGHGAAYLDDLTVRTALPGLFGQGAGTWFKFR